MKTIKTGLKVLAVIVSAFTLYFILTSSDFRNVNTQSVLFHQENHKWASNLQGDDLKFHNEMDRSLQTSNVDDNLKQLFLDHNPQDILHLTPPEYLPQLKNPCWYETNDDNGVQMLRCLPYFMLIGQAKCGTTDLFKSIQAHPDVISPANKEPQFWPRHRHCYCCANVTYHFKCRASKPQTWNTYINFFDRTARTISELWSSTNSGDNSRSSDVITGEGSPSTMWDNRWWWNYRPNMDDDHAPALTNPDYVRHFLPNEKIIVILRNPVDRLYSEYFFYSRGQVSAERFHNKVQLEIDVFQSCIQSHDLRYCLYHSTYDQFNRTDVIRLHNGLYSVFIRDWMERFPRGQLMVVRLEDYGKDKTEIMTQIYNFLGLRTVEVALKKNIKNKRRKKGEDAGDMLQKTRDLLTNFYHPYTVQLADILQDRRFLWYDNTSSTQADYV